LDYRIWFSSVPRSMATLLQIITGDSWSSQIARPMGEYSPLAWFFIAFILIMVGMGFLNLMSAIFVDSLLEMNKNGAAAERKAKQEAQDNAMNAVAELFAMIDEDGSGTIDEGELAAAMGHLGEPTWKPVLDELGVSVESVEIALSNMTFEADEEGTPVLFYEDFLSLFVILDEVATKKMVYQVDKGISKCMREIHQLGQGVLERFADLDTQLDSALRLANARSIV